MPYAKSLSRQIEAMHVRQRCNFKLLLNAIKNIATMHQESRERDHKGRVMALLRDYEMARELLNDLLSQGIGTMVSKETRKTAAAVQELTADLIVRNDDPTDAQKAGER